MQATPSLDRSSVFSPLSQRNSVTTTTTTAAAAANPAPNAVTKNVGILRPVGGGTDASLADFTVFVSNLFVPDYEIYLLWLKGQSVEQALVHLHNGDLQQLQQQKLDPPLPNTELAADAVSAVPAHQPESAEQAGSPVHNTDVASVKDAPPEVEAETVKASTLIGEDPSSRTRVPSRPIASTIHRKYILSQYRNFEMLEHYLHRPQFLHHQLLFPLPHIVKLKLIELYYGFDEQVVRELLGKKLNTRTRKDLDEVCEKANVTLGSCRRQFDNLKRVAKGIDEMQGSSIDNIQEVFLLPRRLASRYAHVIFLQNNRLETSKKKLSQYTFADLEYCASVFMRYWVSSQPTAVEEFDEMLAQDIRDIKAAFVSNKEATDDFRVKVMTHLVETSPAAASVILNGGQQANAFSFNLLLNAGLNTAVATTSRDFPTQFKTLLRNMLQLGCGLSVNKEVRDLFMDLVEKVMELCAAYGWRAAETEAFFVAVRAAWPLLTSLPPEFVATMHASWYRLVIGIQLVTMRLFNDISVALQMAKVG